jgi:hypothetical protein
MVYGEGFKKIKRNMVIQYDLPYYKENITGVGNDKE